MAFNIPPKAFLSFSKKQVVDTLWRIAGQIEQSLESKTKTQKNIQSLNLYLDTLANHIQPEVAKLSLEIKEMAPFDQLENLQKTLMLLERLNQMDLRDDQFLISTEDTEYKKVKVSQEVHIILDNLRSSFNVGSLIRSAEALGAVKLHLCGYTATPDNAKTAKSALGADFWVEWTYWENTHDCIKKLKEEGLTLYAFETAKEAVSLHEIEPQYPCALLLGNERYGVSEGTLSLVDHLISIPLKGRKNSLNVAVCGAIGMHHFLAKL